jgi:hypothetical protein
MDETAERVGTIPHVQNVRIDYVNSLASAHNVPGGSIGTKPTQAWKRCICWRWLASERQTHFDSSRNKRSRREL